MTRWLVFLCLIFTPLAGCRALVVQPDLDMPLDRFEERLRREGGPGVELRPVSPGRVAFTVPALTPHVVAWSRDGGRLAVADRRTVRVVDPAAVEPVVRLSLPEVPPSVADEGAEQEGPEAVEPTPRLFWLADGRLWVAVGPTLLVWPGSGGQWSGPLPALPAGIRGVVDVGEHGRRVLLQARVGLRLATPDAEGWTVTPPAWLGPSAVITPYAVLAARAGRLAYADFDLDPLRTRRWPGGGAPIHRPWPVGGGVHVVTGERHVYFPPGSGPPVVEPLEDAAAVVQITDAGIVGVDRGGAWLRRDGQVTRIDPAARAAAIDPAGRRLALVRPDGLVLHRLEDGSTTPLTPLDTTPIEGVALADGDRTWVLGVERDDGVDLPVLDGLGRGYRADLGVDGVDPFIDIRFGWLGGGGADGPIVEYGGGVSWYPWALSGGLGAPARAHLFGLGMRGSAMILADSDTGAPLFDLRVGLPLIWRTRRLARLDGVPYTDSRAWSVSLGPGVAPMRGALDVELMVYNESYGGIFARTELSGDGVDRVSVGYGLSPQAGPTELVIIALAAGVGLALSLVDGACDRCPTPFGG